MPGRLQGGLTRRRAVLWTATILSELPTHRPDGIWRARPPAVAGRRSDPALSRAP